MLIDSHCHLDFEAFDNDRSEVVTRAAQAGVATILNPGLDLDGSAKVVEQAGKYPQVFAAIGLHPNESAAWSSDAVKKLKDLAGDPKVVAIGEIGLDNYWDKAPKETQQAAFREQLALAAELGLPVIVHNRDAGADVINILLEWHAGLVRASSPLAERPGVLHSFSGSREMAEKAIAAGFFIGLAGPLTFKNAKDLQAMAVDLSLDHLLVETDSPFLSPHPFRGQRNEPAKVKLVAEKLAELKNLSFDEIATAISANAQRLFHFGGV